MMEEAIVFKDAREVQIGFLGLFLILGISTRDWTIRPEVMVIGILSCLVTQWLGAALIPYLSRLLKGESPQANLWGIPSWRSALITSLGLCLLLRTNHYPTMALAGMLAIGSKFLLRDRDKHFFNPANFGIIAVLLFSHDAWVSPGQWGTDWWYFILFAGTGGLILKRVGRWDTSAAFLGVYAGLEALRYSWLGLGWDIYLHQFTSGSLLLFALFMLTDPRSIPNDRNSRLIWSVGIAGLTFILQEFFYLPTAMFWALFALSPLTIWLDQWRAAPRFIWQPQQV